MSPDRRRGAEDAGHQGSGHGPEGVVVYPVEHVPGPLRQRALDFARRVYEKAGEDNIFFLAGAISFNILVAFVPLFLFAVGVAGIVLTSRFPDPGLALVDLLGEQIPAIEGDIRLESQVREAVNGILDQRAGFTTIGILLLIWFSTRLVGTLRTSLREVFDVAQDRGIVGGKIFDAKVVVIGGGLFLLNLSITSVVTAARDLGVDLLGLQGAAVTTVQSTVAFALSFASIWVLFVGVYRFMPARWIPWRTALIAATFTAVAHEVLKWGFGWYASDIANWQTTYGNLVTLAALFLWIYYESVVFILGGEIAQVSTMRRARRVKTRRALFGEATGPEATTLQNAEPADAASATVTDDGGPARRPSEGDDTGEGR